MRSINTTSHTIANFSIARWRRQGAVEQAAGQVTHFASTDFEFGIVAKMNDGLKRFFKQLHEVNEPNGKEAATAGVTKADDRILVNDVLPYIKKYLDFNEAELADRSRDNEAMASWLVGRPGFVGCRRRGGRRGGRLWVWPAACGGRPIN